MARRFAAFSSISSACRAEVSNVLFNSAPDLAIFETNKMKSVAIVSLTCLLCLMPDLSLGNGKNFIGSINDADMMSIDVGSPGDSVTVCETERFFMLSGEEIRFKSGNFTSTGELAPCWLFVVTTENDLIRLSSFSFDSRDSFAVDLYDSLVKTTDRNLLIGKMSGKFQASSTIPLMQTSWKNCIAIRFSRFPSLKEGFFSGKLTVVPRTPLSESVTVPQTPPSTSVTACQTTRVNAPPGKEIHFQLGDNFEQAFFYRSCWLFVTTPAGCVIKVNVTFSVPKINQGSTTILQLYDSKTATQNQAKLFTSLVNGVETPQTSPSNYLSIQVIQLYRGNGYGFTGTITAVARPP